MGGGGGREKVSFVKSGVIAKIYTPLSFIGKLFVIILKNNPWKIQI